MTNRKIGFYLYLPPERHAEDFLRYFCKIPRSGLPLVIFHEGNINPSDYKALNAQFRTIPKLIPPVQPPETMFNTALNNQYSVLAFMHIVQAAKRDGTDWFFCLENDCRFNPKWDSQMVNELNEKLDVNHSAVCAGTPVIWNPMSAGHAWARKAYEYAYLYSYLNEKLPPISIEHGNENIWSSLIYPNGALAAYETEVMNAWFDPDRAFSHPSCMIQAVIEKAPFDVYVGLRLRERGPDAFKAMQPLSNIYSGCTNRRTSPAERVALLKSGRVVAVHHLKHNEHPYE